MMALLGFLSEKLFVRDLQEKDILNFQWQILKLQMSLEDSFYSLAQDSGKPCVLLCDRGVMDGSAYMTTEQWEELKALRGSESEGEDREGCVGVPQGCCAACQLSRACSHALQRPNGHQWQPAAREPAGGAGHAVWRRRLPDQACALRCVEGSQLRLVRARHRHMRH